MSNTDILPRVYFALVIDGEVASLYFIGQCLEPLVAAFSSNPQFQLNESLSNEQQNVYDLIVDGEFTVQSHVPKFAEEVNAIFQSNPTVIPLTEEQLAIGVGPGWFWDGAEFTEAS